MTKSYDYSTLVMGATDMTTDPPFCKHGLRLFLHHQPGQHAIVAWPYLGYLNAAVRA